MRVTDFRDTTGASRVLPSQLEQRFESFRAQPSSLQPFLKCSRLRCNAGLWKQVDAVVDRRRDGDELVFKICWKLQWIEQPNVGNEDWLQDSMEKMKIKHGRRYSDRNKPRKFRSLCCKTPRYRRGKRLGTYRMEHPEKL